MRARTSRSTSFFLRRAASRSAAVAMRSISRRLESSGLVEHGEGVGREDLAVGAGAAEAELHILGGVVDDHGPDGEPALDSRIERAVLAQLESVLEVGEAHEDERQEGSAVPFVIQEDVQMVEGVLVKQVCLVEQEDRVDAVASEVLDVGADGVEDGRRGGGRGQAEGLAELAVEVAAAEGGVVAVGQPVAGLGQAMTHGPHHARLTGTGLTDEEHLGVFLYGLAHLVDDLLLGGREPEESLSGISLEKAASDRAKKRTKDSLTRHLPSRSCHRHGPWSAAATGWG